MSSPQAPSDEVRWPGLREYAGYESVRLLTRVGCADTVRVFTGPTLTSRFRIIARARQEHGRRVPMGEGGGACSDGGGSARLGGQNDTDCGGGWMMILIMVQNNHICACSLCQHR